MKIDNKNILLGALVGGGGASASTLITQTITEGETTKAPSSDAVFNALENSLSTKANLVPSPIQNHILLTNNTGNPIDSGKIFNDGGTTLNDVFTASKVLSIISTLPTGSGSGVTLYLSSEASLNSYQTLSRTPSNAPSSIATAIVSSVNPKVFLKGFLSPILGITKLNSASWTFNLYASCNVAQDTATLSIEAYTYSATGVETLLFTADSGDINFTIATQITFEPTTIQYNINTTDRLLIKVYAKSDHNNDVSVSLYYDKVPEGLNTNANSHIHTPISVPHNQQEGLNDGDYKHLTDEQYNKATQYSSNSLDGILSKIDYQKFDNKQSKVVNPINNNITTTDATGQTKDSGFSINNTNPFNSPSSTQIADAQSTYNLITQIASSSKGLQPVKLYLNTNQILSGLPTQGGYTCVAGDRVICTAQTNTAQNLIYVVNSGAWTIASDSLSVEDLLGSWTSITEGTYLGNYTYLVSITPPNGTSAPTSVEWSAPVNQSLYDAGTGLTLTGGTFSIANTGIANGNYTVAGKSLFSSNSQGQLTSASNVSIATSDLANINESGTVDSQVLIYNGVSSKYTNKNISGDATLSNAGALTIANGVITGVKIASSVALAGSPTTTTQTAGDNSTKIATTSYVDNLTSGRIKVGNASNVATGVVMSGDATISNTGALTISNNAVSNTKLAQMSANTLKGNNTGATANSSDLTVAQTTTMLSSTTPTASTIPRWDANKNLSANNLISGFTTTTTSGGTTTLTVASTETQVFSGTTTQTVVLPVASTLVNGINYNIINSSTGSITVQTSGGNALQTMASNSRLWVSCINNAGGTGTASWAWHYLAGGSASVSSLPVGAILPIGSTTAPTNTLLCDGASLSRTTYANLFSAIGTAYGSSSATTFNIPDFRGLFLRGADRSTGRDPDASSRITFLTGGNSGDALGSYQADQFGSHTHTINFNPAGFWYFSGTSGRVQNFYTNNYFPAEAAGTATNSNTGGNQTNPKNIYVNYAIQYQ